MNRTKDKKKLEEQLINEFIQNFYEKIGYHPLVILQNGKSNDGSITLSLNELESYFTSLLPIQFNERVPLSNKNRMRPIVELRSIFTFIARSMGYTYKDIGIYLGGRDHTTTIHSATVFKNLYETDDTFRNKYFTIINNIKNNYEPSTVDDTDKTQD
jgi:hypothetical protein